MSRNPSGRPRRLRALCVDDEPAIVRLVGRLLERMGIDVSTATAPQDALAVFDADAFDLVITDIKMPGMDGHAFLEAIRDRDPQVPVIVATGHASLENAIRALRDGASGMLLKPFTVSEFRTEVSNALERARIRHDAIQYRFVTPILDGVALALTAAIDARDLETGAHCMQLGRLGEQVATILGLTEQERMTIRIGGYLHDVGKIGIADRILLKPGPLDDDEYEEMRRHSDIGAAIVQTHEAMTDIAAIVRHHHERFDGNGYPGRLHGTKIPLGARIIAIADAFSAMTNDRVYRKAIGVEQAWDEIVANAGTQFDPALVELFEGIVGLEVAAQPAAKRDPRAATTAAATGGHPRRRIAATYRR